MFATLVVPLDGSDFAAAAIPAAAALARAGHADLRFVGIARDDDDVAHVRRHVQGATRDVVSTPAPEADVIVSPDPAEALLKIAAEPADVLCFASHDHPRVAARIMHAVGSAVIARAAHPLVVVGADVAPSDWATEVVVAVDGVHDPETTLATATAWAQQMHAAVRVVTVYEPVPADISRPSHFTRAHGPPGDPDEYLHAVRRVLDDQGAASVSTVAIADPVSVAGGLADHLADRPARLLVVGAAHRRRLHPTAGTLRDLLRAVAVPVLVVKGDEW